MGIFEIIVGLAMSLVAALGWGEYNRRGKNKEREGRQNAERQIDVMATTEADRREIDQRFRETEGDQDARADRVRNPNDF